MDNLVRKLRSQIGDDVQEAYLPEALFKLAADRLEALQARVAELEAMPEGISDQRLEYDKVRARILAGKASQQDASDAIDRVCRDAERLAVISGKQRARAEAAEARIRELEAAMRKIVEGGE